MEIDNSYYSDFSNLLKLLTSLLSNYLQETLPELSSDWWKECVVQKLSYYQQETIIKRRINSLKELDLAALLKILDGNWFSIANKLNLLPEYRHLIKETQSIRNRWAHTTGDEGNFDDKYRDLDTIHRFINFINPGGDANNLVQSLKDDLLIQSKKGLFSNEPIKDNNPVPDSDISKFSVGQIVRLTSNPESKGAIIAISKVGNQTRYNVFINNIIQHYYESQLQPDIINSDYTHLSMQDLSNLITSIQLKNPGLSTLYSLNAARIDFIPYQFRPVLKFIRSDRPRLLIADGVGVGKTIEAGLILKEMQARRNIKSVLIICPRPLVTEQKWQQEMKRFDEKFVHLDGGTLRYCINETDASGEWPEQYHRSILPFSLFDEVLLRGTAKGERIKRNIGLLDLDPPPRFDLVIVDEAHHVRNADTIRHQVVSYFCDHAEAVVFLTATPIQMGNDDLYVLLRLLRPDLVIDRESFVHMIEPNPYINSAISAIRSMQNNWTGEVKEALRKASETAWGNSLLLSNPEFKTTLEKLSEKEVTNDERISLLNKIESFHSLSGIINRTRRKDIGNFTIRKPETVYIHFTEQQRKLHDEILEIQKDILSSKHATTNIKFMLSTIRRQTASCIFGLKPFLKSILTKHIDELEIFEIETDNLDELPGEISDIAARIMTLLDDADRLDENDPKFNALIKIVSEKQQMPNNRVMLFSTFRHTLSYLYQKLQNAGIRTGLIHGGVNDDDRRDLRERFEMKPEDKESIDVLLFSEVGCEGLDYQFCDCIVNYDLPWNPMRVEQRIGRIDRNGQKSESILIYNLITPNTIDAEIYDRCLVRIGVFTESIGDCEEILGELTNEIQSITENYLLTQQEQNYKLQQIADNKIRLYQEQETLEKKQFELFGINISETAMRRDIDEAYNYWISQQCILGLVNTYLHSIQDKGLESILGNKELKTLRLSQEVRKNLLTDFLKLPQQKNITFKEWEKWLKGENAYLQITFDANFAKENPNAVFITPMHPFVLQAANSVKKDGKLFISGKAYHDEMPAGSHQIAIYQWQYMGLKESMELKTVSTNPDITSSVLQLLETAEDNIISETSIEKYSTDLIEENHYELWVKAKEEHLQKTTQIINFRKESLQTSHNARLQLLNEQLRNADNDKIKKMRQSQIANAELDFNYRMDELDKAYSKADIIANPIVFGVLKIEN